MIYSIIITVYFFVLEIFYHLEKDTIAKQAWDRWQKASWVYSNYLISDKLDTNDNLLYQVPTDPIHLLANDEEEDFLQKERLRTNVEFRQIYFALVYAHVDCLKKNPGQVTRDVKTTLLNYLEHVKDDDELSQKVLDVICSIESSDE